jgi:MFS family permease
MFNLKNLLIITNTYLFFSLTDGAIRMIVLLHFFHLGFSPLSLAFIFLLYELVGVITNLVGGWLASYYGIKRMFTFGVLLQIFGLFFLSFYSPSWGIFSSILWVMIAQGISGIAKDISKTSSKSAIKIVSGDGKGILFKWVSWFTGLKNISKGLGFFVGSLLIEIISFQYSLYFLMFFLIICLFFLFFLDSEIGVFKTSRNLKQFFSKSKNINILSMARLFLFGSRDIWFVVGLPIFLYSAGWSFWHVGSFLAFWIIGYGFCQSFVPFLIKKSIDGFTLEISLAKFWVFILMIIQLALLILIHLDVQYISTEKILIFVLLIYGGVFSINSALHSYLILKFSGNSSVTEDVGFYYSSNALGRFFGTFLSGYLYQITGITGCIGGSFIFILISFLIIKKL